jgi:hypothetical protein
MAQQLLPDGSIAGGRRAQSTGLVTVYVDPSSGSDNNDGLTAGQPKKHLPTAVEVISNRYDHVTAPVIKIRDGSLMPADPAIAIGKLVGALQYEIHGNSVRWQCTASKSISWTRDHGILTLRGTFSFYCLQDGAMAIDASQQSVFDLYGTFAFYDFKKSNILNVGSHCDMNIYADCVVYGPIQTFLRTEGRVNYEGGKNLNMAACPSISGALLEAHGKAEVHFAPGVVPHGNPTGLAAVVDGHGAVYRNGLVLPGQGGNQIAEYGIIRP